MLNLRNIMLLMYVVDLHNVDVTATTNSGKEYIIVFLEHIIDASSLDIYVSTTELSNVVVEISAPMATSAQEPLNVSVTNNVGAHISLNTSLALKYSKRYNNGILIRSSADITVQCFSTSTSSMYLNSVGGFLALPTNALGTKYMVVTYVERNRCFFAVVGVEDGTDVTVTIKVPPVETAVFENRLYGNGDVLQISINKFQAVQISSMASLSGTLITASRNIAVFVGADYSSAEGTSKDHLVEQLSPLDSWGMEYVLLPFPRRKSYDIIQVTAQFKETTVSYYNTRHLIGDPGESITFELTSNSPTRLWSNKRILVMQIATSYDLDPASYSEAYSYPENLESGNLDLEYSDPCMLLVPPVEQSVSTHLFMSPLLTHLAKLVVLVITANTNCASRIALTERKSEVSLTWLRIADTNRSVSYTRLEHSGPYSLVSLLKNDSCPILGGYIYGPGFHSSWAMPVGQAVRQLPDKRDEFVSTSVIEEASTSVALISIFSTSATLETSSIYSSHNIEASTSVIITSAFSTSSTLAPSPVYSSYAIESSSMKSSEVFSELPSSSTVSNYHDVSTSLTNTDISSLQPSSTATAPTRTPVCTCTCKVTKTVREVNSKIDEIHKHLTVEKKALSATRRKTHSAVDTRRSSLTIGLLGITFICATFFMISLPDIIQGICFLKSAFIAKAHRRISQQ